MKTHDMECILKIHQIGNLSKAAEEMFISQPALSRILAKVENALGVAIFDKTNHPWKLTYAGELYIESTKKMLAIEKQLFEEIKNTTIDKKGHLKIGAMFAEERNILPKILSHFNARYQDYKINILSSPPNQMNIQLIENNIDFAIMPMPENEKIEELEYLPIQTYNIFLALPLTHELTKNYVCPSNKKDFPEIDFSVLSNQPFISLKQCLPLYKILNKISADNNFKPKIVLKTHTSETALEFVANNYGAALVSDENFFSDELLKRIALFKIKNYKLTKTIAVVYKKDKKFNPAEKEFLRLAKNLYK